MAKILTIHTCVVGEGAAAVEHPPGTELNVTEAVAAELVALGSAKRSAKAPKAEAKPEGDAAAAGAAGTEGGAAA